VGTRDSEGTIAVAEEQTEGRGRLGRQWEAPAGRSLLFSVLLRPDVDPARLPELSPLAGEAVARAIATVTGAATTVKLPNDVLVAGRKVAGVLGEVRDGTVVLGIGINANVSGEALPRETRLPATSLLVETGKEVDRAALLVEVLDRLEQAYDSWLWHQPGRTALVVPVPEAEPIVGAWRRAHTPSGSAGMPAHVTMLVPFVPVRALTPTHEADAREVAAGRARFPFVLEHVERFEEGTLYLAPEPPDEFVALIRSFAERFPDYPPYGGAFAQPVPHLTIASSDDASVLARAQAAVEARLPIEAEAREVLLVERNRHGRWVSRTSFPLAESEPPGAVARSVLREHRGADEGGVEADETPADT